MKHLYELTGDMQELKKLADDPDMEISVKDTLEGIEAEFNDKAQGLMIVANGMDSEIAMLDNEIDRLTARKRATENRKESLKDYLRENMEANGIKQIKCPLFTINCVQGRQIAVIDDAALIPDEYVKVEVKESPDKNLIASELKEGKEIPGAHLERAKSAIRIK